MGFIIDKRQSSILFNGERKKRRHREGEGGKEEEEEGESIEFPSIFLRLSTISMENHLK